MKRFLGPQNSVKKSIYYWFKLKLALLHNDLAFRFGLELCDVIRAQIWSCYKHSNTMKYLTGITSAGVVNFLSHGWGGCVSVKEITLTSRFLDYLQHAIAYLLIVYLRGISLMWSYVENTTFYKRKNKIVDTSRKISNLRIHVARVTG